VVKEEKRHRIDNHPILKTIVDFRAAVFDGNPYAWTPAGTIEDLDAVTVDLCRDFYRRYYAPNNAVLVVVGDFDPDALLAEVRRTFGPIPHGPPVPAAAFTVPPRTAYEEREVRAQVQVPILIGGYIVPEARHPDVPALEVLATILAHGESSRLHRRLVREEKIAFQAGASPQSFERAGLFLVYALFPPVTDRRLLLDRLLSEAEDPGRVAPTPLELRKAKAQLTASHVFGLLSAQGRAIQLGEAELIEGDHRRFLEGAARYDRVTAEDVVRVGAKYLVRSNLSVMVQDPVGAGNGGNAG
jgi:predicted Zn-dependent peptidase